MNTADLTASAVAVASNDSPAHSAPAPIGDRRFALLATGGFALIVAVLLWRHAPWRDELQAWAIVRDNPDPRDLVAQLRYEGHPALWYLVLWVPARISRSIAALQFTQWLLAVGTAYVVARWAPFPRTARILIIGSYFPLFEYGVIARSYTLVWLLTVASLAILPHRRGLVWFAIGAALLANTTVLAIPLALALAIGVLTDNKVQPADATRRARIGVAVAAIVGTAVALLTARPASDAAHGAMTLVDGGNRLAIDMSAPLLALVPIPGSWTNAWDTSLVDRSPLVGAILALLVVAGIASLVRRRRAALITWLLPALGIPAMLYSRDLFASLRFAGIIFVAAIAALWLARLVEPRQRSSAAAAMVIGGVGVTASVLMIIATWSSPFTGASAAADWLRTNGYEDAPILCPTNYQCSSVGIRLDRPTESLDEQGRFTFATFRNGRTTADDQSVATRALARATEEGTPVVVLTPTVLEDPRATTVASFTDTVVADETYWIAIVRPAP